MASEFTKEFTDQNFDEEVLRSAQPVLVDFWAEWCGPCRMLAPTIDKLAKDFTGKAKIGKLDVDSARNVAMKYDIQSIPTVLLFKEGKIVNKFVGLRSEKDFKEALESATTK
jgi:thioredoxin 1